MATEKYLKASEFDGVIISDKDGITKFSSDDIKFEGFDFSPAEQKIIAKQIVDQFKVLTELKVGSGAGATSVFNDANSLWINQIGTANSNPTTFEITSNPWGRGSRQSKLQFALYDNGAKIIPLELLVDLVKFNLPAQFTTVKAVGGVEIDDTTTNIIFGEVGGGDNFSIERNKLYLNNKMSFKIGRGAAGWHSGFDFYVRTNTGNRLAFQIKGFGSDTDINVNGKLKMDKLDLSALGSYADDAAASSGGVSVGEGYVNSSTGALHRRLI